MLHSTTSQYLAIATTEATGDPGEQVVMMF